jgi:hypothetical protein
MQASHFCACTLALCQNIRRLFVSDVPLPSPPGGGGGGAQIRHYRQVETKFTSRFLYDKKEVFYYGC